MQLRQCHFQPHNSWKHSFLTGLVGKVCRIWRGVLDTPEKTCSVWQPRSRLCGHNVEQPRKLIFCFDAIRTTLWTASLELQEDKSFAYGVACADFGSSVGHFLQICPALNHLKSYGKDKGKVKATKAQKGSRGIALFFLNLSARCGWVVNAAPEPLYLPGKSR